MHNERCTSGSEGEPEKPIGRKADRALRFDPTCAAFYQEGGKCRKSNDLVVPMNDRWLQCHPARRRVPGGRGSLSLAGFRRRGERAATLTVPGASRRSRAGLPQDLWRGRTKHVSDASLFSWSNPQWPDGAEGSRSELDGLPPAIWRMRVAHPGAGHPFYPVPQSRKG